MDRRNWYWLVAAAFTAALFAVQPAQAGGTVCGAAGSGSANGATAVNGAGLGVACGDNANAAGFHSSAFGANSAATNTYATAIGADSSGHTRAPGNRPETSVVGIRNILSPPKPTTSASAMSR